MDTEHRCIFKGFLTFICISHANESTISTLRPSATPTAVLCLALSWGLTTRHWAWAQPLQDHQRREGFFFTSGHLEARATGSLTNWASNKGLKQPQGLSAPEVSWKAQALMKEWMVRRACYYLMGDHICGMNWEGFVSSVQQLPLFSGDNWDGKVFWMVLFPHLCYHSCISALIQVWVAQSRLNSEGEGREENSVMLWEKAIGLICGETCFAFFCAHWTALRLHTENIGWFCITI